MSAVLALIIIYKVIFTFFCEWSREKTKNLYDVVSNPKKFEEVTKKLSCPYLGVGDIERVEKRGNGRSIHSLRDPFFKWTMGMYPYQTCSSLILDQNNKEIAFTRSIDVIMTVADKSYSDVIPAWARIVRKSNKVCAVAALDDYICQMAQDLQCQCTFVGSANAISSKQGVGWHKARVAGVKNRFLGALTFLYENKSVFMHDADVFFREDSVNILDKYFRAIQSSSSHGFDFIVQSNGKRDTAYDGLNWGMALMHPTPRSVSLLECTLERWDDEAFGCRGHSKCDKSYYKRSQPRINRILEEAMSNDIAVPRVCQFKEDMMMSGHKHFTGYTSVQTKIVCGGLSRGFLFNESQKTLSYNLSGIESPALQRLALQTALELASQTGRKLEVPRSYFHHIECEFCMLFSIRTQESMELFTARSPYHDCAAVLSSKDALSLKEEITTSNRLRICLPMRTLIDLSQSDNGTLALARHSVYLCNPQNPAYRSTHMCTRETSDEI